MALSNFQNTVLDPLNFTGWKATNPYNIDYSTQPQAPDLVTADPTALNAFANQAERTGPSTWANEATAKSYTDQAHSADTLAKTAMSNTGTSEANLAQTGGSRSGANERIQTSGNRSAMAGMQGLAAEGNSNRAQIGINDEQNRVTELGMLPGMEQQRADSINQNLQQTYQTKSGMWGAAQQGNATANAAQQPKQGTWICTEVKKMASSEQKWAGPDADALGELKHFGMKHDPKRSRWYLDHGHTLISAMHAAQDVNWPRLLFKVQRVIALIKGGKMNTAYAIFKGMSWNLVVEYLPEQIAVLEDL